MKQLLLSSIAVFSSLLMHAQQKHVLTVREAVELAYKNVVELKNAQVDYRIQEAQNKEITGRAYPNITGNTGLQYYLKVPQLLFPQSAEGIYAVLKNENLIPQNTVVPPPQVVPFSFQQPWNFGAGATLTQLLFQPDVFVGLQARSSALELSESLIAQTKEKIKDSAYRRYYAILVVEKQLFFVEEGLKRLQKLYHDDSIMYVNGFAERLDLEKVQVQINNLRFTHNSIKSALEISYAALKFSIGIPQTDTVVLKEELTPELIKSDLLDTAFKYEDRTEIRTLLITKQLQELDVKRNKLSALPTVAFSGNYNITAMGPEFVTSDKTFWLKSSFIGLNVSVPIFDGFQRKYRTQQAQLRVQKIDNTIQGVKQVIDLQKNISSESLRTAIANLDIQERNLALALKVYNTTKTKFEQGLGSSFEVLQADADYQMAQANYFNALYNAAIARVSYQSSLGKLQ